MFRWNTVTAMRPVGRDVWPALRAFRLDHFLADWFEAVSEVQPFSTNGARAPPLAKPVAVLRLDGVGAVSSFAAVRFVVLHACEYH